MQFIKVTLLVSLTSVLGLTSELSQISSTISSLQSKATGIAASAQSSLGSKIESATNIAGSKASEAESAASSAVNSISQSLGSKKSEISASASSAISKTGSNSQIVKPVYLIYSLPAVAALYAIQ